MKIPIRFEDTIHELNGKLKNSKNKDKNKEVSDVGCLDVDIESCDHGGKEAFVESSVESSSGGLDSMNSWEMQRKEGSGNGVDNEAKGANLNMNSNVVNGKEMRLCNLPLEAWSINGISALASRIGKPLIMDAMTASMCKHGTGRIRYARVLIEVQAKKDFPEKIDVVYHNALKDTNKHKTVQVRYDWTPPLCTECGVFGHSQGKCKMDAKEQNINSTGNDSSSDEQGKNDDGFVKVQSKKAEKQNETNGGGNRHVFRPKVSSSDDTMRTMGANKNVGVIGEKLNKKEQHKTSINGSAGKNTGTYTLSQSNKFEVLNEYEEGELNEMEIDMQNENSSKEIDDVCDMCDGIAKDMNGEDIRGRDSSMSSSSKQDEVSNIIREEKFHMCVVLETHLKNKHLGKVCDKVFGPWNWFSNVAVSDKGLESSDSKLISFMSFVYAANSDFNVTLNAREHSAGSAHMSSDTMEINDCVNQIEVDDLCCFGLYFTWTKNLHKVKKGNVTGILKKLDRVMDFLTIMEKGWNIDVEGCTMYSLVKKMKALKGPLSKLSWKNGNLVENIKKIQSDLKDIQTAIDADPFNKSLRDRECVLLKNYLDVVSDEEKLLYQKSPNPMVVLKSNGEMLFIKKLPDDESNFMIREVNDREIKDAMFSIGDNKAQGPDGFFAKFFKKAWHIVSKDVCRAVKEFFSNGQLIGELNATIISLVPKIESPFKVSEFRPIACCDVIQDNILLAHELVKGYGRMFCHGDIGSAKVIKKSLEEFGKLLLIASVLEAIHMYWCNVFLLPKNMVKKINKILKNFLWNNEEVSIGSAKVAWKKICKPKIYEGLGLKDITVWNKALLNITIPLINTNKEDKVSWISQSEEKQKFSMSKWYRVAILYCWPILHVINWPWEELISYFEPLRDVVVHGGAEKWTDVCPLKDLLSNRDIVRLDFSLENSVSILISDGVWRRPLDWLSRFPFLAPLHVPVLLDDRDDVIQWRDRDGVLRPFSVACVWDTIRSRADMVYWYNVVWFSHCIPRHAIHMWLVIQQKLKTQDMLLQWDVWSKVRVLCGMDAIPPHLSDVVAFIVPLSKGKTIVSIISRIVVAATSYYIWLERNGRLFKKKTSTPGQIVDVIFSTVRLKLVTFKFKKMSTKSRLLLDQ
ncbi:RNA-directed DNA polymerase, eukaryota, reverse transcriptase zinc-binding domain protein [Tanacetum coccineum]